MVRTRHFHCRGLGSILDGGTKIPKAVWRGQKKKKKDVYFYFERVSFTHLSLYGLYFLRQTILTQSLPFCLNIFTSFVFHIQVIKPSGIYLLWMVWIRDLVSFFPNMECQLFPRIIDPLLIYKTTSILYQVFVYRWMCFCVLLLLNLFILKPVFLGTLFINIYVLHTLVLCSTSLFCFTYSELFWLFLHFSSTT